MLCVSIPYPTMSSYTQVWIKHMLCSAPV